ncbi:uncharacterized protein DS421_17g592720 [Arachis hypogaea]|nr:uncharacterized protein DS421_17g592720 [Arachis hypogaea]
MGLRQLASAAGKCPCCRRRRILPLLLSEIRAAAVTRELLAELLPGCRRTGSETVAVQFSRSFFGSIEFGCCMLRLELLRLLRKWLGTEVLAAGILIVDLGLRRKGLYETFGLWICVSR